MKHIYCKFLLFFIGISLGYAQSDELQIIQQYLVEKGLDQADIDDLKIQTTTFSKSLNATNVYVIQQHKGIPIKNSIGSFAVRNGKVIHFAGNYITNVASKVNTLTYSLSPEQALDNASISLGLGSAGNTEVINEKSNSNSFLFSNRDISIGDIPVELVYQLIDNKLKLCWDLSIQTLDGKNWYSVRVDSQNGEMISKDDWMIQCTFENHNHSLKKRNNTSVLHSKSNTASSVLMDPVYKVFPLPLESPSHGDRQLVSGAEDVDASPFGWHDTDGIAGVEFTVTQGNNVLVSEDFDGNNGVGNQTDGGENLIFDFSLDPQAVVLDYQDAAMTNLFYVSNVFHDIWYHYGFDEASGNFQFNNYARGGQANDEVLADAQDGSGFNNANFGTPPDGINPRMQMFLWSPQNLIPDAIKFEINNSAVAGEYVVANNNFNPGRVNPPDEPNPLTADLVLAIDDNADTDANDICSAITNAADLAGKIAVVRRGSCNFTDKVVRCQDAGAIAVIVVNNVGGDLIAMGSGADAIGVPAVPAVMVSNVDGEAIINAMSGPIALSASLGFIEGQGVTANELIVGADGSFDNGIIAHEIGHGVSTRLTGGASNSNCLSNTEQMGEGWSDWFGLVMTIEDGDTAADVRGIGTYAIGQPTTGGGIRPFPYSTDMSINPVTYGDVANDGTFSVPHGIGSIWASIIWDLTWAFIERDGFDPDLYNGTGGNNKAMQLVMDGLKLQSCNPGFVDGRDGILAAAESAINVDGDKCLIWEVFARRGVGFSANQGSSDDRFDQTEAFDLPPAGVLDCSSLGVDDFNAGLFTTEPNPSNGIFNIRVAENIGDTIITIFDINGRMVYNENALINGVHRVQSDLRSGMYLLRIEAENGSAISTSKIIVK